MSIFTEVLALRTAEAGTYTFVTQSGQGSDQANCNNGSDQANCNNGSDQANPVGGSDKGSGQPMETCSTFSTTTTTRS